MSYMTYPEALGYAQELANRLGMDVGIEAPSEYCRPGVTKLPAHMRTWNVRILPSPPCRFGWELRCEVVQPAGGWRGARRESDG